LGKSKIKYFVSHFKKMAVRLNMDIFGKESRIQVPQLMLQQMDRQRSRGYNQQSN